MYYSKLQFFYCLVNQLLFYTFDKKVKDYIHFGRLHISRFIFLFLNDILN